MYTVFLGLFAYPFGVFGRLCSVIVALPWYLLYYPGLSLKLTMSLINISLKL